MAMTLFTLAGLAFFALAALGISSILALVALQYASLRRFVLTTLITPPAAVVLYFLTIVALSELGSVCSLNLIWDPCATVGAKLSAGATLAAATCLVAIAAFWAQRVLHSAITYSFESKPMSLFRNRPHWSRIQ